MALGMCYLGFVAASSHARPPAGRWIGVSCSVPTTTGWPLLSETNIDVILERSRLMHRPGGVWQPSGTWCVFGFCGLLFAHQTTSRSLCWCVAVCRPQLTGLCCPRRMLMSFLSDQGPDAQACGRVWQPSATWCVLFGFYGLLFACQTTSRSLDWCVAVC